MTFGFLVRRYRRAFGLRQRELARLMRYQHASTVALLERSRQLPRPSTVIAAAKALNIPVSLLLVGVDDPYDALRCDRITTVVPPLGPRVTGAASSHAVTSSRAQAAQQIIDRVIREVVETQTAVPVPRPAARRVARSRAHRRRVS